MSDTQQQADREALDIRNALLKLQADDGKFVIQTLGVNDPFALKALVDYVQNIGNARQKILDAVTALSHDAKVYGVHGQPIMRAVLHGEQMLDSHFRGVTEKGQAFFYCPVGRIVSWSPGDHDNKWCHFEGIFVEGIQ